MAEQQQELGLSDDHAGYIFNKLLEAGSDMTSSTLHGFIRAEVVSLKCRNEHKKISTASSGRVECHTWMKN